MVEEKRLMGQWHERKMAHAREMQDTTDLRGIAELRRCFRHRERKEEVRYFLGTHDLRDSRLSPKARGENGS
jgi:hypothetical protein